jgi:hypothetical protein
MYVGMIFAQKLKLITFFLINIGIVLRTGLY